ncbi:MAG: AraC family transcriptional regulator [Hyphomicrobiales bacterium]
MTGQNKRIAVQRAASLMLLPPLLTEFGVGMEAVLQGTGVAANQLRPDAFIPYAAYVAILDNACRLTGHVDIGLQLGQRQTLSALGPLGVVMRHAATLGEALAAFVAFQINNSTGGAVYLLRGERDVILGYGVYDASVRVSPQLYDLVLAVGCKLIAELTGGAGAPEELLLSRVMPDDPGPYLRLARCPVRFRQNQTGVVLSVKTLALPLPDADATLHGRALARLQMAVGGAPLDTSGHVRHVLRSLLLTGQAGMEDVAARLGLHSRALRRRLRQEGTTFEAIKDEVRHAAARELLMLGDLGITDIAITLDYASASSFVHAFRRWNGVSPGQWRQQMT